MTGKHLDFATFEKDFTDFQVGQTGFVKLVEEKSVMYGKFKHFTKEYSGYEYKNINFNHFNSNYSGSS